MLTIKSLNALHLNASNLSIELGEAVSLKGPSGSGKSLFLRAIADLIENTSDIQWLESSRNDIPAPDWRKSVTYVGAESTWWADLVKDHFISPEQLSDQIKSFDLPHNIMTFETAKLSSGEAQRLGLLRALERTLTGKEHCFLLDEPTSALDLERQIKVEEFLKSLLQSKTIAVVFISHDERQIDRLADRRWEITNNEIKEVQP